MSIRRGTDVDWLGPSGDDHVIGVDHIHGTVAMGDFHLPVGQQFTVTLQPFDAVGFEQCADAVGQLQHDVFLARHHLV